MKNKLTIILSILLMVTLSGCQQSDVSPIPTVLSEDRSDESISIEDEQVNNTEIFYLPLVVNSLLDFEVNEIYISQSNSPSWGENLTGTPLTDKVSIELMLPVVDVNSLTWDFLLVDANGNEIVIPEVDFSNVTLAGTSIVFELNDAGEYFYFFL